MDIPNPLRGKRSHLVIVQGDRVNPAAATVADGMACWVG
jgi:hypothetical protein